MRPLRRRVAVWAVGAYYALALVVMGSVVLAGMAKGSQPTPRAPRKAFASDIPAPVPPASPEPVPTVSATPAPEIQKPAPTPRESAPAVTTRPTAPVVPPRPSSSGTTMATHYTPRPEVCWDPGRSTPVPPVAVYTAAHYPCGTTLEVTGPAGTVTLQVWDHGPWGDPQRGLDLSPAAFESVVGPLSVGVCLVHWNIVP